MDYEELATVTNIINAIEKNELVFRSHRHLKKRWRINHELARYIIETARRFVVERAKNLH